MTTTTQQLSGFRFAIALSIIATLAACGGGSESSPASMTVEEAKSALQAAGAGLAKLNSFHAKGTITRGGDNSSFQGDFGRGSGDFTVNRADGEVYRHIGVGDRHVFSSDGGATWKPDAEKLGEIVSTLFITGPLEVLPKVTGHPPSKLEVVANERIDGVEATHVRFNTPSAPIDYWIANDATLGPWIKRLEQTISATDGEFRVDVAYSKINAPVNITVPQ